MVKKDDPLFCLKMSYGGYSTLFMTIRLEQTPNGLKGVVRYPGPLVTQGEDFYIDKDGVSPDFRELLEFYQSEFKAKRVQRIELIEFVGGDRRYTKINFDAFLNKHCAAQWARAEELAGELERV